MKQKLFGYWDSKVHWNGRSYLIKPNIINSDKLIYLCSGTDMSMCVLDKNYNMLNSLTKTFGLSFISADGLYIVSLTTSKIFSLIIDYETGGISYEELREFPSIVETEMVNEGGNGAGVVMQEAYLNGAGNILWIIDQVVPVDEEDNKKDRIRVYSVDFNNENPFHFLFSTRGDFESISTSREVIVLSENKELYTVKDFSKLVALKYDGSYFYRQDPGVLTAQPSDVKKGVTFIGRNGIPENGTLETSTGVLPGGGSSGGGGGSF